MSFPSNSLIEHAEVKAREDFTRFEAGLRNGSHPSRESFERYVFLQGVVLALDQREKMISLLARISSDEYSAPEDLVVEAKTFLKKELGIEAN